MTEPKRPKLRTIFWEIASVFLVMGLLLFSPFQAKGGEVGNGQDSTSSTDNRASRKMVVTNADNTGDDDDGTSLPKTRNRESDSDDGDDARGDGSTDGNDNGNDDSDGDVDAGNDITADGDGDDESADENGSPTSASPSMKPKVTAASTTANIVREVFANSINYMSAQAERGNEEAEIPSLADYPLDPHELSYYGDSKWVRPLRADGDSETYLVYRD